MTTNSERVQPSEGQHTPKPLSPLQQASQLASKLEINSVRFRAFSANAKHTFQTLPTQAELVPSVRFTRPKPAWHGEELCITTALVFGVSVKLASGEEDPAVSLRVVTELLYSRAPGVERADISDDSLYSFAALNAPFHAWGYWREFVQTSLARLDLPTITLPLYRVNEAVKFMFDDSEGPDDTQEGPI